MQMAYYPPYTLTWPKPTEERLALQESERETERNGKVNNEPLRLFFIISYFVCCPYKVS